MASVLKVDKLDPQSGTALELGTSGDTISVPSGATLDISASTLTPPATMPASSGINLTALNATNLGSGTVPTARLGTGTASSSTVLYGDQTYKAEPGGGKLLQIVSAVSTSSTSFAGTSWVDVAGSSIAITPSATTSKILLHFSTGGMAYDTCNGINILINSSEDGDIVEMTRWGYDGTADWESVPISVHHLDSPASTSEITYKLRARTDAVKSSDRAMLNYGSQTAGLNVTAIEIGA